MVQCNRRARIGEALDLRELGSGLSRCSRLRQRLHSSGTLPKISGSRRELRGTTGRWSEALRGRRAVVDIAQFRSMPVRVMHHPVERQQRALRLGKLRPGLKHVPVPAAVRAIAPAGRSPLVEVAQQHRGQPGARGLAVSQTCANCRAGAGRRDRDACRCTQMPARRAPKSARTAPRGSSVRQVSASASTISMSRRTSRALPCQPRLRGRGRRWRRSASRARRQRFAAERSPRRRSGGRTSCNATTSASSSSQDRDDAVGIAAAGPRPTRLVDVVAGEGQLHRQARPQSAMVPGRRRYSGRWSAPAGRRCSSGASCTCPPIRRDRPWRGALSSVGRSRSSSIRGTP